MPETVIELDLGSPWVPPEPPAPRRLRQARWPAVAAVLVVVLGVLVSGGPRSRAGLLYTVEQQILSLQSGGGRLYVGRYQTTGPGPLLEARGAADGAVLWTVSTGLDQHPVLATDRILVLATESVQDARNANKLTALDAGSGRPRWERDRTVVIGTAGGLLIVEDEPDLPTTTMIVDVDESDVTVNRAPVPASRHVLALDQRTGATAWEVTVPAGSLIQYGRTGRYPDDLDGFDELAADGRLIRRDARTGATTATLRLDLPGAAASFTTGYHWMTNRTWPGRLVVYLDGEHRAVVYDIRTGRRVFEWDGVADPGLFTCGTGWFCARGGDGIELLDGTTGRRVWHLAGHDAIIALDGDRMTLASYQQGRITFVDARTGAVTGGVTGWQFVPANDRLLLWKALDERTALLGRLDPATGLVHVFAQAGNWFGNPGCTVDAGVLACLVGGALSVWRLP